MAEGRFDMVVVGAGPAGEKAAAQAAYFGKSVAVVEEAAARRGDGCERRHHRRMTRIRITLRPVHLDERRRALLVGSLPHGQRVRKATSRWTLTAPDQSALLERVKTRLVQPPWAHWHIASGREVLHVQHRAAG